MSVNLFKIMRDKEKSERVELYVKEHCENVLLYS